MKKIYLTAALSALALGLASPVAQAATASNKAMMSNFYVGGYGGYGWTDADVSGGPTFDVDGADYGLFAGYELKDVTDRSFGLTGALEFHYGWSNADDSGTVGVTAAQIEKEHEWGISFRPGLTVISDNMPLDMKPYGILGYRRAEFDSTTNGSKQYNGFELGVGTELIAFDNFGTRLDYTHVFYDGKSGIDPDENNLRLGVAVHF